MGKNRKYTPQQLAIIRRNYAGKSNQKNTAPAPLDMHIAKIRNRYLFKSDNSTGEHTYVVYTDTENNEVRAIPATHLYVPDKVNMSKLDRGLLRKVKFAGYETPSGVENYYHNCDADGKPLSLTHVDVKVDKTALPQKQAHIIKAFAKNLRKTQ